MPRVQQPTQPHTVQVEAPQATPYQKLMMESPLNEDLILPGPRGSGKSRGLLWLIVRDVAILKQQARMLFLRASFPSLREVEQDMRRFFPLVHPGATYNATSCLWSFPNGATCELGYIDGEKTFNRYLGRSFSTIIVDEATLHGTPDGIGLLRSCLRAPDGTPTRMIVAGNPGFIGTQWFRTRWILPAYPLQFMVPARFFCEQTERWTVVLQASIRDNPHLNYDVYVKDLELAAAGDPERLKAWVLGDWDISSVGAALADVYSEKRSLARFDAIPFHGENAPGRLMCVGDYGTASPCAFYLAWVDKFTKDITLIDELYTCGRGRDGRRELHRGIHQTVTELPGIVADWLEPWRLRLADISITIDNSADTDAGGFNDTAVRALRRGGMRVKPIDPRMKDREAGYISVRQRLFNAGRNPRGLYWTTRCEAWRDTANLLERDDRTGESVKKSPIDHPYDGIRYLCMLVDRGFSGQATFRLW